MKFDMDRHLNAVLRPKCDAGDPTAIRDALTILATKSNLPEWLLSPLLKLAEEAADKPIAIGKGPRATDQAVRERNWIDLSRYLALEEALRQQVEKGQKRSTKAALTSAKKARVAAGDEAGERAITESVRRIKKAMGGGKSLELRAFLPGPPENFADFLPELEPQE
jgi:hypothetical protein